MRSFLLIIISAALFGISGCKKAPTFSMDNEHDPQSENYKPRSPIDPNILVNNSNDLIIDWSQLDADAKFISGYKIYKSVTDTVNFKEIGTIKKSDYHSRDNSKYIYRFTDPEDYNGIFAAYKIQSFYVQYRDTTFSDAVINTFIVNDFQMQSRLWPFKIQPVIELFWSTERIPSDASIEFYSRHPNAEELTTLGSAIIQGQSAEIELDIYQPEETEYYYRISLDSISSNLEKIKYELSIPVLDLELGADLNDETSAEIELSFSDEFTDYEATLDHFTISLYESDEPIELAAWGEADTTLTYKKTLNFTPPSTSAILNNLDPAKYYMVTASGYRGSHQTQEEYKYLTFNFINTLSKTANNNLYEDDGFQGSFNRDSDKILFSYDRSMAGIINVENGQIEHTLDLEKRNNELQFISSVYAEFDGIQDAIITSNSSDKIQIWNPETYNLISEIPNYSNNLVDTSPWDFTVISPDKLLIAYLPENEETKRTIFITLWDQSKEQHELIYQINQDIIYPEQTKLIYNQAQNLFHFLQRSINQEDYNSGEYPRLKLLSIDANNHELLSNVEITNLGQGSFENMTLNDKGDYLYIFNEGSYTQFDVLNFEQNHTIYFRYLKSLVIAKESNFKCLGGNSSNEADIQCFWKHFDSSPLLFEHHSENYITGLVVNDSGTRLAVLYQHVFQYFDFTKRWRLDR